MSRSLLARELSGEEWVRGDMRRMGFTPPAEEQEGPVMADPDVESLANEMATSAAVLVATEAIAHLKAVVEPDCDPAGIGNCNWCCGREHSDFGVAPYFHYGTCPWVKAKAFIASLK